MHCPHLPPALAGQTKIAHVPPGKQDAGSALLFEQI
jgi:hypothetical protein